MQGPRAPGSSLNPNGYTAIKQPLKPNPCEPESVGVVQLPVSNGSADIPLESFLPLHFDWTNTTEQIRLATLLAESYDFKRYQCPLGAQMHTTANYSILVLLHSLYLHGPQHLGP